MAFHSTRSNALRLMRSNLTEQQWEGNTKAVEKLKLQIKNHSLASHPAISSLQSEKYSLNSIKQIHLEYRHAIVQIFTDALLMAQLQSRQLEPRLTFGAKMGPRCLLTLNILDEFGFAPGVGEDGYYLGNPSLAHYPLFEDVLKRLGISEAEIKYFNPSGISNQVREFLESSFTDYLSILVLLAVAEEQVILFSQPLRQTLVNLKIDTDVGYYVVHGTTDDKTLNASDDQHEDDLWYALIHGCTASDFERITSLALRYCDLWNEFWTYQYASSRNFMRNDRISCPSNEAACIE